MADNNPEDVVRGGVLDGNGNDEESKDKDNEGGNGGAEDVDIHIDVEGDGREKHGGMTFLDVGNAEHVEEQIVDLMDTDLGNNTGMKEAIRKLGASSVRTVMVSTGAGGTEYNKEIESEAISGKRRLTMNEMHSKGN